MFTAGTAGASVGVGSGVGVGVGVAVGSGVVSGVGVGVAGAVSSSRSFVTLCPHPLTHSDSSILLFSSTCVTASVSTLYSGSGAGVDGGCYPSFHRLLCFVVAVILFWIVLNEAVS